MDAKEANSADRMCPRRIRRHRMTRYARRHLRTCNTTCRREFMLWFLAGGGFLWPWLVVLGVENWGCTSFDATAWIDNDGEERRDEGVETREQRLQRHQMNGGLRNGDCPGGCCA